MSSKVRWSNMLCFVTKTQHHDSVEKSKPGTWDLLTFFYLLAKLKNSNYILKERILRRIVTCVEASVYCLPEVTEVAKLISNCTLTDIIPHQKLPNNNSVLTIQVANCIVIPFHHLMTSNYVLCLSLYSKISACRNNKIAWCIYITNILLTISHDSA